MGVHPKVRGIANTPWRPTQNANKLMSKWSATKGSLDTSRHPSDKQRHRHTKVNVQNDHEYGRAKSDALITM